jgi:hypothetical protein
LRWKTLKIEEKFNKKWQKVFVARTCKQGRSRRGMCQGEYGLGIGQCKPSKGGRIDQNIGYFLKGFRDPKSTMTASPL